MSAVLNINKLFVLMLENRSYDNLFGWSDLRGWRPDGTPTQADGLLGKPPFCNAGANGAVYTVGQGAPFRLAFDPGHEFSDALVQLTSPSDSRAYATCVRDDSAGLTNGAYPACASAPNDLGFARDMEAHGYDAASAMRCFTPDQLPVLNFLAQQFGVCDRWFSSVPGPTWPNRFFALAGTSWGLDHSPSELGSIEASLFDGAKYGNGKDSLFTRLAPEQWLVAHGDIPQAWAVKGADAHVGRFVTHEDFFSSLASGKLDAHFVFIEPHYDPIGNFQNGESMHPCGDVRLGEALIERVYNAIVSSPYWEQSVLLIVFDEHGGFFDHVIPDPAHVAGMPTLAPVAPTGLTKRGFRFDRFGLRVPALVVSPYVKQATIDHTFYDHASIAKTLAKILPAGAVDGPLLDTPRFAGAADFSSMLTLSTPRKASDIHPCPHALPVAASTAPAKLGGSAAAFRALGWPGPIGGGAA
jgi:phospholipase C